MTPAGKPRVVSVGRLVQYLKRLLNDDPNLRYVAVRGEISNMRQHVGAGGTLYFSLKDELALLPCVAWPEVASRLPALRDGAQVVVVGSLGVYAQRGSYQLTVDGITLDGAGDRYAALEALRSRLQNEGLFAQHRKRELPRYPFCVALVSSATAQGANDFRRVLARRSPHIQLILCETPVQGTGAAEAIAAAIGSAAYLGADLIAVVRGGGSFEDLFAFHAEIVVRAIVASPIPVITGIGHESDVALADHAADVHAATPTAAAMHLPATDELIAELLDLTDALQAAIGHCFRDRAARVALLLRRLEHCSPAAQVAQRNRRLLTATLQLHHAFAQRVRGLRESSVRLAERMQSTFRQAHERRRQQLTLLDVKLQGRDPDAILALGYAIISVEGRIISMADAVRPGTHIHAQLAHGALIARVETVQT